MSNVIKLNAPQVGARYHSVADCSDSADVAGFWVDVATREGDAEGLYLLLIGPDCIETLMAVKNTPEALASLLLIGKTVFDGISNFWMYQPEDNGGEA